MDRNWIFGLCRKMSVQESICACAAFCIANSAELLLSKAGLLCTLHYCMDFLSNPLNSTLMSDAKKNPTNFFLDISQEIFSFLIFNFGARVLVLPEQNEFLIFFLYQTLFYNIITGTLNPVSMHFFTKLTWTYEKSCQTRIR